MLAVFRDQFAFKGVDLLDQVVKLFEEGFVFEFGAGPDDGFLGKPAALVTGIEDFEIAAFDLDDQPQLLGELEGVSIVFRSAVDEIADVNGTGLQAYFAAA